MRVRCILRCVTFITRRPDRRAAASKAQRGGRSGIQVVAVRGKFTTHITSFAGVAWCGLVWPPGTVGGAALVGCMGGRAASFGDLGLHGH